MGSRLLGQKGYELNRTPSSLLVTSEVGLDSWDSRSNDVTMNNGIRVSDTQSSPQHIM